MNIGADAAGALDKMMGILRCTAFEDHFNPPEHLAGTPGICHPALGYFDLYAEVSFNSGDRIYDDSFTHSVYFLPFS